MGSWRCETAALTSLRAAALHVKSHQERPVVPISQRRRLSLRSQDGKELGVEMGVPKPDGWLQSRCLFDPTKHVLWVPVVRRV